MFVDRHSVGAPSKIDRYAVLRVGDGQEIGVTTDARRGFAQSPRYHVVKVRHESIRALNASENCDLASIEHHLCEIASPARMNKAESASCECLKADLITRPEVGCLACKVRPFSGTSNA